MAGNVVNAFQLSILNATFGVYCGIVGAQVRVRHGPHSIHSFDTPSVKFIGRNIFTVYTQDCERQITISIIVIPVILHKWENRCKIILHAQQILPDTPNSINSCKLFRFLRINYLDNFQKYHNFVTNLFEDKLLM